MRYLIGQTGMGIVLVLVALAFAPVLAAIQHGPGAPALALDHKADHSEQRHGHNRPAAHHDSAQHESAHHDSAHHESADHDHVVSAILPGHLPEDFPAPDLRRPLGNVSAGERVRDGPRRPPRIA